MEISLFESFTNFINKTRVERYLTVDLIFRRNLTRLKSPIETKDMIPKKDIINNCANKLGLKTITMQFIV
jgi:hypothetical protein